VSAELRLRLIEKVLAAPAAALPEIERVLERVTESQPKPDWHHAPPHRFNESGTYMVTAATYDHEHVFRGEVALDRLQAELLAAREMGWDFEAWAVFSNHYHFVAQMRQGAVPLSDVLHRIHQRTALWANERDGQPGRKVWHNFWDTHLTFERSYLARLNYVMQNPVKHGLVPRAELYRWCSTEWFQRTAPPAHARTVFGFQIDRVKVEDDFDPV
jgi:putative transposase